MSDKPSFFAELKRRNVIPMDYADDSIPPFRFAETLGMGPA